MQGQVSKEPAQSREGRERQRIILGVCAMEKKVSSKPMQNILQRIEKTGQFCITVFDQKTILQAPVEDWPHPVDVLICFFSEGFPLEKAEAYVALRNPFCINHVTAQRALLSRPA